MYKIKADLEYLIIKRSLIGFFLFATISLTINAQTIAEQTKLKQRIEFRQMCEKAISDAETDNPNSLSKALWITSAFNFKGINVDSLLDKLIANYDNLSMENKYALLAVLAEYPYSEKRFILNKAIKENQPKLSLLAYSILHKKCDNVDTNNTVYDDKTWSLIKEQINESAYQMELSNNQLQECISYIKQNYPIQYHLIVLTRADRNIPAKVYILAPGDSTLKGKECLSYLARSAYNILPYFTNGNTPCGVFKIIKKSVSSNNFIGPTTTLVTELPYESSVEEWNNTANNWSEKVYENMWPASICKIPILWQAYLSGKVGRSEIIVHGSTIDPYFFREEPYFPLTPSLGCLSALELWDMNTGGYLESHQKRLVDKLPDCTEKLGFMYVLQIDENAYRQN